MTPHVLELINAYKQTKKKYCPKRNKSHKKINCVWHSRSPIIASKSCWMASMIRCIFLVVVFGVCILGTLVSFLDLDSSSSLGTSLSSFSLSSVEMGFGFCARGYSEVGILEVSKMPQDRRTMSSKSRECLPLRSISQSSWLPCELSRDLLTEFSLLFMAISLSFPESFAVSHFLSSFGILNFGSFIPELIFLVIFTILGNKFFLGWLGLLTGDDITGLVDLGLLLSDLGPGEGVPDILLSSPEDKSLGTWRLVRVFSCCSI